MEKEVINLVGIHQPTKPSTWSRGSKAKWLAVNISLLLILIGKLYHWPPSWTLSTHLSQSPSFRGTAHKIYTDWESIPTSEKLLWVSCFPVYAADFFCARLTVPMDYNRPLGPKVHIALVLLPGEQRSPLDPASNFSASPLILNPGGPGGWGTQFVLDAGPGIQVIAGRHRDVVSFDPRGIGATWPPADCFMDAYPVENPPSKGERNAAFMRRVVYTFQTQDIGLANSSDKALGWMFSRGVARAQLCKTKDGEDSIFRHIGTPNVARDLMGIVNAWDAWNDERFEASRPSQEAEASRLDTRGKLVYWGFSYGTFLGATFASMFPDNVGRLILDGVTSADFYFKKEAWGASLYDTDAALAYFFQTCVEAGDQCFFYKQGQKPDDLEKRYQQLMVRLEAEPLVIVSTEPRIPVILRTADVQTAVFKMLYFPMLFFPTLALLLLAVEMRLDMSRMVVLPDLAPVCAAEYSPVQYGSESTTAISCSDRRGNWEESVGGLQQLFEELSERSSFADFWMNIMSDCSGWDVAPVDPPGFTPKRVIPRDDSPPVNTSFPIMFISNTYDNVTPLRTGLAMSRRFVDAGFVEQKTVGHCSLAAVSLCMFQKVRAYLDDGKVPHPPRFDHEAVLAGGSGLGGEWETCESDEKPWKPFNGLLGSSESAGFEVDMVQAWRHIQGTFSREHSTPPFMSNSGPFGKVRLMDAETAADIFQSLQ